MDIIDDIYNKYVAPSSYYLFPFPLVISIILLRPDGY